MNPKELLENSELAALLASREGSSHIRVFFKRGVEQGGITPECILRQYPMLSELFQVLSKQGERDRRTFHHAREVANYAGLIAKELGLPTQMTMEIGIAAWFHDIGKLSLPGLNGELQKRLSKLPELNLKIHPTLGVYILKNLIHATVVLRAVRYHHAHFDGTGEPSRLQGEEIPLEARIIAVADAFEHLHWIHEGKKDGSQQEIFLKLREKAGRELDPHLVECLIRCVAAG